MPMPAALDVSTLLAVLAATIVATKLFGDIAQRIGQPAVLGELLAGDKARSRLPLLRDQS